MINHHTDSGSGAKGPGLIAGQENTFLDGGKQHHGQ